MPLGGSGGGGHEMKFVCSLSRSRRGLFLLPLVGSAEESLLVVGDKELLIMASQVSRRVTAAVDTAILVVVEA